jgi:membrane AbrB-like protein
MTTELPSKPARSPVRHLTRADLFLFLRTITIGVVGGAVFNALNLPLPWMMGAMAATGSLTLARIEMAMDSRLRTLMILVLGVFLGSAFSPEILDRIALWPVTLAALVAYVFVSTTIVYLFFRFVAGFDPKTAFFSGVPGGLNEMIILTQAAGGDEQQVSMMHTTRIFLVVMSLPFVFRVIEDFDPSLRTFGAEGERLEVIDVVVLVASAVVGFYAARLLRIPAPHLTGPMILSAAVHLSGLTSAAPPVIAIAIAQVILGSAVGARFAGLTFRDLGLILRLGGTATVILLVISATFALTLQSITGIPFSSLMLAFSPGGLTEMSLVALALEIDTAFVATHHIARISVVVIVIPLLFQFFDRAGPRGEDI